MLRTGLVQQTDQIVASHDLSLFVRLFIDPGPFLAAFTGAMRALCLDMAQ